jgi:tetratricopeptide (TPR) repeat protein
METMQKALALNHLSIDALTVSAGILEANGRRDQAQELYERALAIEPESRHLRTSLAGNLASRGELRQAIGIYEGLIRDFPEEQAFYQFAGIAHSYLGEYDKAVSLLTQAAAIRPTPVGYFNLAVAHEKGGRLREAADNFRLYLQNSQGESEANIRKARAEFERLEKMLGTPSAGRR